MGKMSEDGELVAQVHQQQHTGNHEQGEHRDQLAGTRAGAENVETPTPGKQDQQKPTAKDSSEQP